MIKKWSVSKLSLDKNNTDFENVVKFVEFIFNYSNGDVNQSINIVIKLDNPTGSYVEYNNLTEEIILNWLYNKEDFSKMEANIIESIINPQGIIDFEESLPY
jgi:hypothetical protein